MAKTKTPDLQQAGTMLEGLHRMASEQPEDHLALVKLLARLTAKSRNRPRKVER